MRLSVGRLLCCLVLVGPGVGRAAAQSLEPAPAAATAPEGPASGEPSAPATDTFAARSLDLDLPPLPADAFTPAAAASDRPRGDGRRTLSAFPKNLGRGFVGVFSRESVLPFVLGTSAAVASQALDGRVAGALEGQCLSCGRTGATVGGAAVVPMVGLFFAAGRLSPTSSTFRAASYDMAQALLVNSAWTGILKYSLHRQRPDGSDFLSLPSGHSSTAFALATVVERHYGWKAGLPAYALAAGIGLSRIESNKHYLSDVIAGATIGTIVGRTVTRLNGERPKSRRTIAITPATDPHGAGIGLGFSASW
jgi:hypothetical protein